MAKKFTNIFIIRTPFFEQKGRIYKPESITYLPGQKSSIIIFPDSFVVMFLRLLFNRNIDFGTKYVRVDENDKAKICAFTASRWHFRVRNWVGC